MKLRCCQIIRYTAILAAAFFAVSSIYPIKAFATESITLPVQVVGEDVVSISLPVVSESETSVFDFILDPQGLLYETDAVRYGGGRVEEGATLLFHNEEGEYDFSKRSDWLTVTNRSTVPVRVTVTAQVTDFGDLKLVESADFAESTEPDIYLAIVDDQGNTQPLSVDGQVSVSFEMDATPENTYVFRLDEENHTYQYGMSMDPNMVDFDTYSFGLIGACNPNAEWQDISVHPTITVTWYVEPIMPEEQQEVPVEDNNTRDESNTPNDEDKSFDKSDDVDDESDRSDESNHGDESDQGDESNQDAEDNQNDENELKNGNLGDNLENNNVQNEDVADGE